MILEKFKVTTNVGRVNAHVNAWCSCMWAPSTPQTSLDWVGDSLIWLPITNHNKVDMS